MRKLLWIYLFATIACHAEEILDLETLPNLRTQQYPMGPYQKIVVFSASRTGSSLVYNVFKFLFENQKNLSRRHDELSPSGFVFKTHKFSQSRSLKGKAVLYVVPIRDPLQASISMYRIRSQPPTDAKYWSKRTMEGQTERLAYAEERQKAGHDVIFLKYEDFDENLDYLIDVIENHFSISISDSDKNTMALGYSRENVYSNIRSLNGFREYLPVSGFHGQHTNPEKFTPPDEVLYWLNQYLEKAKPLFMNHGYVFN